LEQRNEFDIEKPMHCRRSIVRLPVMYSTTTAIKFPSIYTSTQLVSYSRSIEQAIIGICAALSVAGTNRTSHLDIDNDTKQNH
jgi:hypothetical protein